MLIAFSRENRGRTAILLVAAVGLAIGAAMVGIDDNALGILLAVLSAGSLVVSVVHPWRDSSKFKRLIHTDIVVFIVLLLVGVPLSILGDVLKTEGLIRTALGFVGTTLVLAAGFLCIPAFVVGLIGLLVTRRRERTVGAA